MLKGKTVKNHAERVLRVLAEHSERAVTLSQIQEATGLDSKTIQTTIGNLRNRWASRIVPPATSIETVARGQAWILHGVWAPPGEVAADPGQEGVTPRPPAQDRSKLVLRWLGNAKNEDMIFRDQTGILYRVERL